MISSRLRLALFCCVSVALLAAALLLAQRSSSPGPTTGARVTGLSSVRGSARPPAPIEPGSEDGPEDPVAVRALAAERIAICSAARAFLAAFVSYEVGDLSASVGDRLRRHATPAFAAMLLGAAPQRTGATMPARGRLGSLEVTLLGTASPPTAVVEGTAIRAGRSEPFGFTFQHNGRGWLAAAAGP